MNLVVRIILSIFHTQDEKVLKYLHERQMKLFRDTNIIHLTLKIGNLRNEITVKPLNVFLPYQ